MPVIAIAAAATSFAVAAPIFAAAGAMTATAVMAGAVMAGSAMTILGTVTGNKNLTKIGSVLGIAGGIGLAGISTFGGGLDTTAKLANDAAASNSVAAMGSTGAEAGAAEIASASAPTVPTTALTDALKVTPPGAQAIDAAAALTPPPTDSLPSLTQMSQPSLPAPTGMIGQAQLAPGAGDAIKAAISTQNPNLSMWDKFLEFNKTNPAAAKMGFDAFQSFATALVPKPVTEMEEAQTDYYKQRTLDDQRKALAAGGYASGSKGLVNSSYYGRSTQ